MRILYVENHAIFAGQACRLFLAAHAVTVVSTLAAGRQALAAEPFDLLLVNFDLDDGKGDELVRAARSAHPGLPIIAVSAHEAGNNKLLAAGATAVCSKMRFDTIQTVIDNLPGVASPPPAPAPSPANVPRRDNLTAHNASDYDARIRKTIPFYDLLQREVLHLIQAIQPHPARWLDTGCGTGYLADLALTAFPHARFMLADPSEAMLARARMRLRQRGAERVEFLSAVGTGGLAGPLARGSFQVVTAIQCHHYLDAEGRRQALRACFELLAPGGLFVTAENIVPRTPEGVRIASERWKAFLRAEGWPAAEAEKHLARTGAQVFPITIERHLEGLTQAGFQVAELFWHSQMQAACYGIKPA